ncbi:unnamed protein product, partial [Didymodactylos carnosus]
MYPQHPSAPPSSQYSQPTQQQFGSNPIGNAPPAQRSYLTSSEERMAKFQQIVGQYEINQDFAMRLRNLEGFEIVFICDDSGSMGEITTAFERRSTRWDELKQTVSIVVDVCNVLDPDGVDIYFLNRQPLFHVKNSSELIPAFSIPPTGATPLARCLRQVLRDKQAEIQERKLLVLIATDGVPTDDAGRNDIRSLEQVLKHERDPVERVLVTFIACTDDDESIGYLNKWDERIPKVDVCDDYRSEKREILKVQGKDFPFSFGDYVVKILMGSVDPWFDNLDNKK